MASRRGREEAETGPAQAEEAGGAELASRTDTMEYLADMILELHDMAQKVGAVMLARTLALAYAEARLERRSSASGSDDA